MTLNAAVLTFDMACQSSKDKEKQERESICNLGEREREKLLHFLLLQ